MTKNTEYDSEARIQKYLTHFNIEISINKSTKCSNKLDSIGVRYM